MKRKWIALVLSVSILAGTAAVPAFASEMQQEISEIPAVETLQDHTLAETDSVEENCSGWTERQLSGKCRCGIGADQ